MSRIIDMGICLLIGTVIALLALLCAPYDAQGVQAEPTLTMSATRAVATPTPIVANPVIMAYEVRLPIVMGGGE